MGSQSSPGSALKHGCGERGQRAWGRDKEERARCGFCLRTSSRNIEPPGPLPPQEEIKPPNERLLPVVKPRPLLPTQEEIKPPSERLLAWLTETVKYMQAKSQGKGRYYYGNFTPGDDGDY